MTVTIKILALNSKLILSKRKCNFKGRHINQSQYKASLFGFYSAGIQRSKMQNISKKIDITTDEQRNVKGRIQNF